MKKNTIINGKQIAEALLVKMIAKTKALQLPMKIVFIVVGDNKASNRFVNMKEKMADKIGITSLRMNFNSNIKEKDLIEVIQRVGEDASVNGIVVQLPLPKQINSQKVLDTIPLSKDTDVLSSLAKSKFRDGYYYNHNNCHCIIK